MANLRKSASGLLRFYGEELDDLLDIHLKPLRSKNARSIFRIFLNEIEKRELTTYDIQARLGQNGSSLSKKEINAWLRSLQEANLISKREERGKPTTKEYRGRYTYDLWTLTKKGLEMACALESILVNGEARSCYDLQDLAEIIDESDTTRAQKIIDKIEESYTLLILIKSLSNTGRLLKYDELERKITPIQTTLNEIVLSRSGRKFLEVTKGPASQSIFDKIFHYLGIPSKGQNVVSLTDEGKRLVSRIWGEG